MADPEDKEYRLPRPMTGDKIRENLRQHMRHSWYQERPKRIQVSGAAVVVYFANSLHGLALYSPTAGWTEGMVSSEVYTALRFPEDNEELFEQTPDRW